MTELQTKKIVAVLMGWYGEAIDAPVYERLLGDLDYDLVNAAVERHRATSRFAPSVAEIREAALALDLGEVRPGGDAWGDALKLRSPRPLAELEKLDPVISRCLDRLDMIRRDTIWRAGVQVARWRVELGDNEAADRARFIELYDQLAATRRREQLSESLPAIRQLRAAQERRSLADGQPRPLAQLAGEVARRSAP